MIYRKYNIDDSPQKIIIIFVGLSFLSSVPTWFNFTTQNEDLHWLIWDLVSMVRISLLPLMAYFLCRQTLSGVVFLVYFYLTMTNIVSVLIEYLGYAETWMISPKIEGAMLIILYFFFKRYYRRRDGF